MITYPCDLPAVDLPDRWGCDSVAYGRPAVFTVEAGSAQEAELRVMAVVNYDYEDDLKGATTEAISNDGNVWTVHLTTVDPDA